MIGTAAQSFWAQMEQIRPQLERALKDPLVRKMNAAKSKLMALCRSGDAGVSRFRDGIMFEPVNGMAAALQYWADYPAADASKFNALARVRCIRNLFEARAPGAWAKALSEGGEPTKINIAEAVECIETEAETQFGFGTCEAAYRSQFGDTAVDAAIAEGHCEVLVAAREQAAEAKAKPAQTQTTPAKTVSAPKSAAVATPAQVATPSAKPAPAVEAKASEAPAQKPSTQQLWAAQEEARKKAQPTRALTTWQAWGDPKSLSYRVGEMKQREHEEFKAAQGVVAKYQAQNR